VRLLEEAARGLFGRWRGDPSGGGAKDHVVAARRPPGGRPLVRRSVVLVLVFDLLCEVEKKAGLLSFFFI
jgi:hypothetical protein